MSVNKEGFIAARRGEDRFQTKIAWLDGRHSFSFGGHWDPTNTQASSSTRTRRGTSASSIRAWPSA